MPAVKVATRLGGFQGDARVTTWVHRIAVNHLLTTRRRRAEDPALTFAAFGHDLGEDLDLAYDSQGVDEDLLAEEVRVGCTQSMLLCLDREHRMAYVLGEILRFSGDEAAGACAASVPPRRMAGSTRPICSSPAGWRRSSATWRRSPTRARSSAVTRRSVAGARVVDAVLRAVA